MTESTDAATLRQTGAEQAPRKCPSCGGEMQVTESPYGSLVADCPKCRDKAQAPVRQQASQQLPRETGTSVGTPLTSPEATNG